MSLHNLWATCLQNAVRIIEILQGQCAQSNTVGEKRKCEDSLPGNIAGKRLMHTYSTLSDKRSMHDSSEIPAPTLHFYKPKNPGQTPRIEDMHMHNRPKQLHHNQTIRQLEGCQ